MVSEPTETDTFDTFMGSGALSYPWWSDVESNGSPAAGWCVTAREYDETAPNGADAGPYITFDHGSIMGAVRALALMYVTGQFPAGPEAPARHVARECCLMLCDPDATDFDADMADQVMQFHAFGRVVYG